jgi:hypothetical protein
MRLWMILAILVLVDGCQAVPQGRDGAAQGDGLTRIASALPGEYDNHEQVQQASAGVHAGTAVAVPHLRETLKPLGDNLWLWHLQTLDQANPAEAVWLFRASVAEGRLRMTPYRALDPAIAKALLADDKPHFKFDAAQWAELAPCAQTGEWKSTQFNAMADANACSALLPGLGDAAALLPLRMTLAGDMLRSVTFADQARGAEAGVDARRLRWFTGWSAINGGGPAAKSDNQDWHMQRDLRLSSEGGRVPLRWRDGAASGWSLELARTVYPERKLNVLQLNLVDDASGRVLDYVWANPETTAIGFNLGWLQVGLTQIEAASK